LVDAVADPVRELSSLKPIVSVSRAPAGRPLLSEKLIDDSRSVAPAPSRTLSSGVVAVALLSKPMPSEVSVIAARPLVSVRRIDRLYVTSPGAPHDDTVNSVIDNPLVP
jgi:hypothetical protein